MYQPVQCRRRPKKCCALKLEWLEDRRLLSGAKSTLAAPLLHPAAASQTVPAAIVQVVTQPDNTQNVSDRHAPRDQSSSPSIVQDVTSTSQDSTLSASAPAPLNPSPSVQSLASQTSVQPLDNTLNSLAYSSDTQAPQSSLPGAVQAVTTKSQDSASSVSAPATSVSSAQPAIDLSAANAQPAIDLSGMAGQPVTNSSGTDGQPAIVPSGASSGSQAAPIPVANAVQADTSQFTPAPVQNVSETTPLVAAAVRNNITFAGSSTVTDAGVASSTNLQSKDTTPTDQQGRLPAGQDQSGLAAEMALAVRKAADAAAAVEQQGGSWAEKVSVEVESATNPNDATAYLGHAGRGKTEEVGEVAHGYWADLQTLGEPATLLMLTPDAQQRDSASEVSDLSAQGSDLVTGFSSAGRAALDAVLQDFVRQLNNLGQDLSRSLGGLGLSPWLLTAAVAATVCEIGRRQRRSARSALGLASGGEPATLTWFAGLPGPLSTEES